MGNVSLSIAALCHAKNLPELEAWFRDIIILEWEHGKLDKYVGILKIEKNALIMEDHHHWLRVSSYVINHCRNVLAFIIQVENEFGSVS